MIYLSSEPEYDCEYHVAACKDQREDNLGKQHWYSIHSSLHKKEDCSKRVLSEIAYDANTTLVWIFSEVEIPVVEDSDGQCT